MKKILHSLLILTIILLAFSCDKGDENKDLNCNSLKTAVIDLDSVSVDKELSKLLYDSDPLPVTDDPIGQLKNVESLVHRINECGQVDAEIKCYACIKTNPPQSEMLIRVDSAGVFILRVIDISMPDNSKLKFLNIHRSFVL